MTTPKPTTREQLEGHSTAELQRYRRELNSLINGPHPCYGVRDLLLLDAIIIELAARRFKRHAN